MQHRTKLDHTLINLVNEFEIKSGNGRAILLDEKDYSLLIKYYEQEFNFDKALEVAELALQQYSYTPDFYIISARLLLKIQNPEEALESIEKAAVVSPNEKEVLLLKARILCHLSRHGEALEITQSLLSSNIPFDLSEILLCEAYIFESMKDYNGMYRTLKNVLTMTPGNSEALERMWISVELSRNFEDSVIFHKSLIDEDPFSSKAWYNLGHAYSCLSEYDKGIEALEYAIAIDNEFEMAYLDCSELCYQIGYYAKALQLYEEIMRIFGEDEELLVSLGSCYFYLGGHNKAKKILRKAAKLDPYNDETYFFLGECERKDGSYKEAIKYYKKAVRIESRREEYYSGLASCFVKTEDHTMADHYFRKATEIGPERHEIWLDHVKFLIGIGEYHIALEVLDEAEFSAVSNDLVYCRAIVLFWLQKKTDAIKFLEEALNDDFANYPIIFDISPNMKFNETVISMIKYFKPE